MQLLVNKDFFYMEWHKRYEYNDGRWEWRAITIAYMYIYNRVSLCNCLRAC